MNLVSFALRRPISLLTMVVAVALVGFLAVDRMSRDIFPDLGVPVLYVAQPYGGMDPAQMEGFIVNYYEYHFLYITGIEHVESKSIQGVGLIKLQFHPGTNMAQATAETVAYVDRARAFMPTGTVPPFVMRFDGGSVPVGDLVFSSKTKTVAELQDAALFKVRPLFATLPGVSAPPPFGSSQRTILVRLDPNKLRSYNMSPDEVVRALAAGNTVSPSGNVRIGDLMPMVPVNSVVGDFKGLNNIPIRSHGTQTIFIRDVGSVEDGADIQTGYALVNGRRTVYIPVTKRADASTLAVVQAVKANLPRFQSVLPDDVEVSYQFDQSPYVTRAIQGLFVEGALGAVLTGLMVLLFLRDWRSSLVVVLNIPLAILASVTALWVSGQTINIMTLGGLALAVGILVDEATVTIENIHTRLAEGRSLLYDRRGAQPVRTAGLGSRLLDGGVVSAFQYLCAGTVGLDAAQSEYAPQAARDVFRSATCQVRSVRARRYEATAHRRAFLSHHQRHHHSPGRQLSGHRDFSDRGYRPAPIASPGAGRDAHRAHRADRAADTRRDQARGRAG
jgi:multidrug efflux pump subunit AcrB